MMKLFVGFVGVLLLLGLGQPGGSFNSGGPNSGPDLDVPCDVDAGTNLSGSASGCNPPITVTAVHNGNHLSGSPDTSGLGGINAFSFPVPSSATGTIIVTAQDALGRTTEKIVEIL